MKLHVFPPSPNAKKAMFVNAHLGLNLPLQIVDLRSGAQQSPEYLALNPNGKVPTLEFDDGTTLWESNAIINKLSGDAKSDLWPASQARYDILRWQFWEACHWTPACAKFIARHIFGNQDVDLDAAAVDFRRYATVLDDHLSGRDWLVGDKMTTADISNAMVLYLREPCRYPLDGFGNITRWIGRIEADPAWSAAMPEAQAAE